MYTIKFKNLINFIKQRKLKINNIYVILLKILKYFKHYSCWCLNSTFILFFINFLNTMVSLFQRATLARYRPDPTGFKNTLMFPVLLILADFGKLNVIIMASGELPYLGCHSFNFDGGIFRFPRRHRPLSRESTTVFVIE